MRKGHLHKRSLAAVGLAVTATLAGQAAASAAGTGPAAPAAGGPGHWSQVTAIGTDITADVGLVRGTDGLLHVIWAQGSTTGQEKIIDTPVGVGGTVQPRVTIASGLLTVSDPDATATPSGLDAFWNGIANSSPSSPQGTFEVSHPVKGGHWSHPANIPPLSSSFLSSDSAGTGSDGKPWVAFAGNALFVVHLGHAEKQIPPTACCVYFPGFGTDGSSGVSWLAYMSLINGNQGIFAQRLSASGASGGAIRLPGSRTAGSTFLLSQRIGITGRGKGRPGVYVLYGIGYPTITALELLRLGAKTPVKLASFGGFSEEVAGDTITAGPNGRLWATWFDGNGTPAQLFVRASGTAGTTFGKTVRVALPSGTSTIWKVYTNAQAGRLDVVALLTIRGKTAYYATQVLLPK